MRRAYTTPRSNPKVVEMLPVPLVVKVASLPHVQIPSVRGAKRQTSTVPYAIGRSPAVSA